MLKDCMSDMAGRDLYAEHMDDSNDEALQQLYDEDEFFLDPRVIHKLPSAFWVGVREISMWPDYIYAGRLTIYGAQMRIYDLPRIS